MSFVLVAFFDVQGQVRGLNGEAKGGGVDESLVFVFIVCVLWEFVE